MVDRCLVCGRSERLTFGKQYNRSGSMVVICLCGYCGNHVDPKNPFYNKKMFDLDALTVLVDLRDSGEPCAICGKKETEYHHFAPRHLFGDDADNWPTAWLCKDHHKEWHDKVTPNMHKRRMT